MTLEDKVRRQGEIIQKVASKGRSIHFNPKRISVYDRKKYIGWVRRSEYDGLKAESRVRIRRAPKQPDRYSVRFGRTLFVKQVSVKSGTGRRKHREWRVALYTKSQHKYVYRQFKRGRIPVEGRTPFQRLTRMRGNFRLLGIRMSSFRAGYPGP